ncbi:TraB/GumN family protein [Sandarakinorhabdus sp.]|uniref:TraB/GumN family protein n=1 Tax=Sandarakinorhabdus sp. TaxID=1916663 RepID=UPI00333F7F82
MAMRFFRLVLALLLAAPALAAPAMWVVEGGQLNGRGHITLYGTVHALPPGQDWFSPAARTAFTAADLLVVEVADSGDPAVMAAAVQRTGLLPDALPLASRLPPALRPALAQILGSLGLSADSLDRLKTWLAAISLLAADLARSGIDPAAGVDRSLIGMAVAAGKPVTGLETAEYQLGLFDALPETEQRLLLRSTVSDAGAAQEEIRALLKAWLAGDVERIRVEFDDGSLSAELEAALLTRRNAAWADWVAARRDQPGQVFVAVGAAHLAGPGSLIALLQARGLTVRRVE